MTRPTPAMVEDFLVAEARLLDAREWESWHALFTDDGIYWMPAAPGQTDSKTHVSLIHDDALLRELRIQRFHDVDAPSLQGSPRGWRMIGNVCIDEHDEDTGIVVVSSRLSAAEHRNGVTTSFQAFVTHHLTFTDGELRIKLKRVELLDCDAARGDIMLYI